LPFQHSTSTQMTGGQTELPVALCSIY